MNHDIHNYDSKLRSQQALLERDKGVSATNKDVIFKFINHSLAEGITKGRVLRYLFDLKIWGRTIRKDFEHCTIDDIRDAVGIIEQSNYSPSTKRDLKLTLRKFFKKKLE